MSEPHQLPDFDNPPVVETVLSVQFDRLTSMRSLHFGLYWRKMQQRFPDVEELHALPPISEDFRQSPGGMPRLRFEALETPSLPRLLLRNTTGTELIQIQNDRFIKNWRKSAENDVYPHYEPVIKPAFSRDFQEFQSFLADEGLGTVRVNQCEITYVNHIVSGDEWTSFSEADRIFKFWRQTPQPIPGIPEDLALHMRFPIKDDEGSYVGRLHADIQPAPRASDNRPMYVMNLTARGQCGKGIDFFDIGRSWIVKSFEQLTTETMHQAWRKKNGCNR